MKPHKKAKLTGTSQKPYEAKQNAVREAETSTKYTKPHKTAKRAETSPKPNKTKQNAARAAETGTKYEPYTKQHKTAKPAETSPKPYKTKQNVARAVETKSDQMSLLFRAVVSKALTPASEPQPESCCISFRRDF